MQLKRDSCTLDSLCNEFSISKLSRLKSFYTFEPTCLKLAISNLVSISAISPIIILKLTIFYSTSSYPITQFQIIYFIRLNVYKCRINILLSSFFSLGSFSIDPPKIIILMCFGTSSRACNSNTSYEATIFGFCL